MAGTMDYSNQAKVDKAHARATHRNACLVSMQRTAAIGCSSAYARYTFVLTAFSADCKAQES
jgi:hypothetical protein